MVSVIAPHLVPEYFLFSLCSVSMPVGLQPKVSVLRCVVSHMLSELCDSLTVFTTDQSALWLMFSAISTIWYLWYICYTYMVLLQLGHWRPCQVLLLVPAVCDHISPQGNQFKIKLASPSQCKERHGPFVDSLIKTIRHCSCIREEILAKMK